jgi:hypothetical protein
MGDSLHFMVTALIFVSVAVASAGICYRLLYSRKPDRRESPPALLYMPPPITPGSPVPPYATQAEPQPVYAPSPAATATPAKPLSRFGNAWTIYDEHSARKAARAASWAAFFVAFVTGVVAFLASAGMALFKGVGPAAWLDAVVFATLGVGIWRMSRIAAVVALVLYIVERIVMVPVVGLNPVMMIAMVTCFAQGVRGTWAFHKFRQQSQYPPAMAQSSS